MKKVAGSGRKKRVKGQYELDLIKSITDMGKPDGSLYSERSILTYTDNMYNFSKQFLGKAELWNNLKWLEDPKKVEINMDTAKTHQGYLYSLSTKMAMYNAIVVSLKAKGYIYDDSDDNLVKIYTERRNKFGEEAKMISVSTGDNHHNTKVGDNQKQVLIDIKPKDILTMVDKMNDNSFKDGELINRKLFMIATMFMIHSEFPFRNDVADVKVVIPKTYEKFVKEGSDKEFNWLIKSGLRYTFILNKFKTKNKYGQIVAKVEDKRVKEQIKLWIVNAMPDDIDNKYLFTNNGEPLTRNHVSVLLSNESAKKEYLGMKVSTTLLAKIFNETPDNYKTMTEEEKETLSKMAGLRGHSVFTHFTVYRNTAL